MRTTLIINTIFFLLAIPILQAADNMKAFPPAEEVMVPRIADNSPITVMILEIFAKFAKL